MKCVLALTTALTLFASVGAASASIVDNFDASGTPGPNWLGDSVFLPVPASPVVGNAPGGTASVDLVGGSYFANLAFSGNSIDLDGSTGGGHNPTGEIQSIASLSLGNYAVSFELSGNQRGAPGQTTTVCIGLSCQSIVAPPDGYKPYTLTFTDVKGQLSFSDFLILGGSNQQGNLLDNVATSAVPEPATWAMMVLGFLGIGFMAYRRKGKNSESGFRFA
jgi:hypothetical protein